MRKLSGALVALTASLAVGAMTIAANAGHKSNGGGNGGNDGNNGGNNMHHHDHDGMGHRHGHWRGGLWIPYYGSYDDEPRCYWRHGHKHCRY